MRLQAEGAAGRDAARAGRRAVTKESEPNEHAERTDDAESGDDRPSSSLAEGWNRGWADEVARGVTRRRRDERFRADEDATRQGAERRGVRELVARGAKSERE